MTDSASNNSVRKHQPALGLRLDFGSQPCPLCFDSLLACSLDHGQDVKLVSRFSQPSDITIRLEPELELELNPDREEFASWLDVDQLPLKDDILLMYGLRSPPVIDIIQLEDDPTLPILVCAPCAVVTDRGISFGRGRRLAADRYLAGYHVGILKEKLAHMGIIVCGAPSKIQRLIRGGPISLVAIFLHSIDDDDLGSGNLSLEEDLLQLNWSAFTPPAHISAAPLSRLLVSRFNIVQTDVKSVVAAASTPIPNHLARRSFAINVSNVTAQVANWR
ncbi:hypothetical protein FFLO_06124 [Filobasidium floriforme]|uniref:Uncharacterized protein n=1 Tax=Filobasidium floriforme TaxID=5210 RepID=A0A8K0JHU2_9TREE|nr:hypothetical protein FFLO_06124 [Filobasidium floriforme]